MNKNAPFKSLADLPKAELVKAIETAKPWADWASRDITNSILNAVTDTLAYWLDARMMDLRRERVHREDISVVHRGGRTEIRVNGKVRFEFKIKITMGGT